MQAEKLDTQIGVQPVHFDEASREGVFAIKYTSEGEDLIVQVFPEETKELRALLGVSVGARVAKAVADTIGEDNMLGIKIEVHSDPLIGGTACYVKLEGRGSEITRNLLLPKLMDHLEVCLTATQL